MTLRLSGNDVASAVRNWMIKEIETAPSFGHEMGKHFFTTSAATIGVIATLAKLDGSVTGNFGQLGVSITLLLIAAIIGLLLSVPPPKPIDMENADLFVIYKKTINRIIAFSVVWLLFWLAGTLWGLVLIL